MYTKDKEIKITIRLNESDNDNITDIALKMGMKKSEYIRTIIQQNIASYQLAKSLIANMGEEKAKELISKYEGIK